MERTNEGRVVNAGMIAIMKIIANPVDDIRQGGGVGYPCGSVCFPASLDKVDGYSIVA